MESSIHNLGLKLKRPGDYRGECLSSRHVIRVQQKRTVERNELNLCGLGSQLYKHVLNTDSFLFQLEFFLPGLYKS